MTLDDKNILITGGTGSFGRKFTEHILFSSRPRRVIIFSRDELKQHDMRQTYPEGDDSPIRYFIGDVRDKDRLYRAFHDVDIVVHAAALKQVPACEYNPIEAVQTNINGATNIIDAAIDQGVAYVMALSTDKAVNPINMYGATKLCAEKMFIQANSYSGSGRTKFAACRYGNVVGSRGSVIPVFQEQRKTGRIQLTDERMTRFWLTLEQGVAFVKTCIRLMHGGELFVPKIPSMRVIDLARAIAPDCEIDTIGIRPGEKMHEALISPDEARHAQELDDFYIIEPVHPWWKLGYYPNAKRLPDGFSYTSDKNTDWLTETDLQQLVRDTDEER